LLKQFQLNFWVAAFGIALPVNIALAYLLTRFVDEPLSRKMKQQLQTLPSIRLQNISALLKLGLRWKAKPANQSL
jgi:peptidoglycan/LPS O-acetylase OafA/YrhL